MTQATKFSKDNHGGTYNRLLFIITLLTGTFSMSISQSSLSTAYPTLMRTFGIGAPEVQWMTTGFMLVMSVMIPVSPWLLNNIKFTTLFRWVTATFAVGTLLCMMAPNYIVLLVGRLIEALGVGIIFPSFQTVLLTITPETHRGATMGTAGLIMGSALATGPVVSGIMLQFTSWRGLFALFFVLVATVFVISFWTIKDVMPVNQSQMDWLSIVYSLGFIGVLFVLNQIGSKGVNWWLTVLLVVSIVAVIGFCWRQLHRAQPLLELHVFQSRLFTTGVLLTGASYIALIVTTIVLPLYYQNVLGLSALASGLSLVPAAVGLSLLNPLSGRLMDRIGPRNVVLTGMLLIVLGFGYLTIFAAHLTVVTLILASIVTEGGNAFVMMPAVTLGANSLPDRLIAHGTAVTTTARQILGSAGVAAATIILTRVTQANHGALGLYQATLRGYQMTFLTFLIIGLFGLALTFTLPKGKQG
ncbi:DHA2 family efflux MFS transporter permease subunit [Furfurilactobacillus siliginis]|uniref:MFS transporter n=1 Tax=Furfurilactobacillus siliginis TaxID=348151 RepID=A0A0R2LEK3_9LACO|nr:DHA2 family efflux MFS transporter permease subunit [Furfurilactobacillus siliginis]KRN96628.1 putative multidrug transport protein (putative) [Furfurilactobacillus siliginis]GEK29390.1 MFS transporter [Furfurilactobacillus siliginis]